MIITRLQYERALKRIEELLPIVTESTQPDDKNAIELIMASDIVEAYEKAHFPIGTANIEK